MELQYKDKERYELVKQKFDQDNRFVCEGIQGRGRDAMVIRLIYTPTQEIYRKKLVPVFDGYPQKILVKVARPGKEAENSNETTILRVRFRTPCYAFASINFDIRDYGALHM
jgi:hypothetical protein